jgi:mannose-6-phosphate isomerase-like protein (cupin superfamily)
MVIAPGGKEGGPGNRHAGADQWLFVVSGSGTARINGRRRALKKGSLVLIEKGDRHEIRNSGRTPLRTLNFYAPPAYASDGDPLPAGKGG